MKDCFILDGGKSGIYVWIGKMCTKEEKLGSMKTAEKFLKENGYPQWTRVSLTEFQPNFTYIW